MLHILTGDDERRRDGYQYSAGGIGVPDSLVESVLAGWARIAPDRNAATTLRAAPDDGWINSPDNLARIAVEAVLEALQPSGTCG